jgi:hypothetical protein
MKKEINNKLYEYFIKDEKNCTCSPCTTLRQTIIKEVFLSEQAYFDFLKKRKRK